MSNEPKTIDAQVTLVVTENQIQPETAKSLGASFQPLFEQARKVLEQSRAVSVTDPEQKLQIKLAREFRLELKRIRLASDKQRVELKAESIRRGRAIDGFHAILLELTSAEETRLEEQEKIADRILAERRMALLESRVTKLSPYGVDLTGISIADMPAETFEQFLENARAGHEAKQEAARKAEAERIRIENERLKEEARIREENARLKKEADEREAAAKVERERRLAIGAERQKVVSEQFSEVIDAGSAVFYGDLSNEDWVSLVRGAGIRLAKKREEDAERDRLAKEKAEAEAKADAAKKAAAKKLAAERAETARLAKELSDRQEADARRIAEEQEIARLASIAPDKEKLLAFAQAIRALEVPELSFACGHAQEVIAEHVENLAKRIETFAETLATSAAA